MLRPYQGKCLDEVEKALDAGVYQQLTAMATGTGKCLAKGTPVLMFSGEVKTVENVALGDQVMGPDSLPRTVLALGHGHSEMFTVTPTKGDSYTVNDAHILSLQLTSSGNKFPCQKAHTVDMSVQEYLGQSRVFKHRAKGYRVGVSFPTVEVPIDPYCFGMWLGDGHSDKAAITTMDAAMETEWTKLASSFGLHIRKEQQEGNASSVYFATSRTSSGRGHRTNGLLNALRELGVINNKHVPLVYKANSRRARKELLAGYLAADGYMQNGGFEFVSVLPVLANDIAFVARSLGLACYVKRCTKGCQTGAVGTYYRGYISGDLSILHPFLKRKQAQPRMQKKSVLVTGIKVTPVGLGEYFGFQLDGDGRFLLGDFTVTHNTVVFANLPERLNKRLPGQMLVLAHRETLIDQAIAKIRKWNPSLTVDKEMADYHADPNADVIVASVASLGRSGTKRTERFNWDNITKVVCDEAHHSTASTYMNIFNLSGVLKPDSKKLLLGFTATPSRGDGKGLSAVYKKIVYTYGMRTAIEDGWLVDVRGIRLNTRTSLDNVKTVAGDFAQDQLADAVNNPVRNQLVVKAWLDNAFGLRTVVFAVDVKHTQDLCATFEGYGIKAAAIYGDGSSDENKAKIAKHAAGEIDVLVNCMLLTEGYDDWHINCVVDAAPTKSSTRYTQKIGRGTRLEEGADGQVMNLLEALAAGMNVKTNCLVIDVVDNTTRHSLVSLPSLVGLSADMDLKGKSAVGSAVALEHAMEDNPHIDFSKLTDITQLKAYVENINMFDVQFPTEVTSNSGLSWYPTQNSGYALMLPAHERVVIQPNLLDKYDITAVISGQKYAGVRDTLDQAFSAADALVESKLPSALKLVTRAAAWHDDVASDPQKRLLRKFYKGKSTPYCICAATSAEKLCPSCKGRTDLTKGHAGRLISGFLAHGQSAAA